MKQVIFGLAILATLVFSNDVFAQRRMPRTTHRQVHQHERIAQGRHSGELTRGEAIHLNRQQKMIRHDKRMAMADGLISPRERHIISREQHHANRSIYRMKHNNRYR
jgi:hypothetical protein